MKQKSKFSKITLEEFIDYSPDKESYGMLKQVWDELPTDVTMGERTLFIEIAEKLLKFASDTNRRLN